MPDVSQAVPFDRLPGGVLLSDLSFYDAETTSSRTSSNPHGLAHTARELSRKGRVSDPALKVFVDLHRTEVCRFEAVGFKDRAPQYLRIVHAVLLPVEPQRNSSACRDGLARRRNLAALLRPFEPAPAFSVEMISTFDGRASSIEPHSDWRTRAALRTASAHVGERRQRRDGERHFIA